MTAGDKWSQRGWKTKDKGVYTIVDINFSKHRKYEDLVDEILNELDKIGAQNL